MKLDIQSVMEACSNDDNTGFCIVCGEEHYSIEPDARNYKCHACGELKVFGAEQIILEGLAK